VNASRLVVLQSQPPYLCFLLAMHSDHQCPICFRSWLQPPSAHGVSRAFLACMHCVCEDCFANLLRTAADRKNVGCPLCRQSPSTLFATATAGVATTSGASSSRHQRTSSRHQRAMKVRVLVVNPATACILLVRDRYQHFHEQHGSGWSWWLPGGSIDFLESAELAAKRQLEEETGIIADLEDLIPLNTDYELHADSTRYFVYRDEALAWPAIQRCFAQRYDTREVNGVWWGSWGEVNDPSVHSHVIHWLVNIGLMSAAAG
jgi:8-oxo-dGTP pyrophosphatase MutT (NUDIX family)